MTERQLIDPDQPWLGFADGAVPQPTEAKPNTKVFRVRYVTNQIEVLTLLRSHRKTMDVRDEEGNEASISFADTYRTFDAAKAALVEANEKRVKTITADLAVANEKLSISKRYYYEEEEETE